MATYKNPNDIVTDQPEWLPPPTTTTKPRNKGTGAKPRTPGRKPGTPRSSSRAGQGIAVRPKMDPTATAALFGNNPLSNMIFKMLGGTPSPGRATTAMGRPVGPASASGVYRAEGSTYGLPTAGPEGGGGGEGGSGSAPGTMTALRRYMDFAGRNPRDVIKDLMDTAGIEAGVRSAIDTEVGKLSAAADAIRNMQAAARPGLQSVVSGAQQQTQATVAQLRENQVAAQQAATADEATRAQMYANTPGLEGMAPQPSNLRASLNADADTARVNEAMLRGSDQQAAAQNAMSRYDQTAAGIQGGYQAGIGAVKASEGKVREDLTRQERINAMKLYEIQSNQLGSLAQIESDTNAAQAEKDGLTAWQQHQVEEDRLDREGYATGYANEGGAMGNDLASRYMQYVGAKTDGTTETADAAWTAAAGDLEEDALNGDTNAQGYLSVLKRMRAAFDRKGGGSAQKRFQSGLEAGYNAGVALSGVDWQEEGASAYLEALQRAQYPGRRRGGSSRPPSTTRTPPRSSSYDYQYAPTTTGNPAASSGRSRPSRTPRYQNPANMTPEQLRKYLESLGINPNG